jgi:hypothetical protein
VLNYGKCQYGVVCLFSKNHLHADKERKQAGGQEGFIESPTQELEAGIQIQDQKEDIKFRRGHRGDQ